MNIKVNGTAQAFSEPVTITELLKINKVDKPDMVSVQLNGEFVDRNDFDTQQVSGHDEVDFLYFMGGGQGKNQIFSKLTPGEKILKQPFLLLSLGKESRQRILDGANAFRLVPRLHLNGAPLARNYGLRLRRASNNDSLTLLVSEINYQINTEANLNNRKISNVNRIKL